MSFAVDHPTSDASVAGSAYESKGRVSYADEQCDDDGSDAVVHGHLLSASAPTAGTASRTRGEPPDAK
jgi:hypothetical protein